MKRPNLSPSLLNLLVVDDDPVFLRRIEKAAEGRNIAVTTCGTLQELHELARPEIFDVAVLDYYLDGMASYLSGAQVANRFGKTPVVLMSGTQNCVKDNHGWPESVKEFIRKDFGLDLIFETARKAKKKSRATLQTGR